MIDGKFDVVFRGQIVKNFTPEAVRANLVALFKSSPEAIERLFSGNETTIRKSLDYGAAMKYQAALRNAGALALIKEVQAEEPAPAPRPTPQPQPRATFTTADPTPAGSVEKPSTESQSVDETANAQPSASDSANAASEPAIEGAGELSLAQVGARILPPKQYEEREVDTSELSLAEVGERIIPPKAPEKHPQPKIDHLAITNDTTPIGGE